MTDTFEDVPFDMRHHTFKPKPKFPREWVMTARRRAELISLRENAELRDQRRLLTGQLVDGVKQIEDAWSKSPAQPTALPEMAMAGKGIRAKGKRIAVKR
jgi:small subunit ribosomal protein S35